MQNLENYVTLWRYISSLLLFFINENYIWSYIIIIFTAEFSCVLFQFLSMYIVMCNRLLIDIFLEKITSCLPTNLYTNTFLVSIVIPMSYSHNMKPRNSVYLHIFLMKYLSFIIENSHFLLWVISFSDAQALHSF